MTTRLTCPLSRGVVAVACFVALLSVASRTPSPTQAEGIATVRTQFADPPRGYSSGPLWTWNDRLTDEQIVSTLRDLAGQKVKQVWVHPRPGLMTPYLSDEWFDRWRTALQEAERLDMNVWIYDENSYPSGFAGGLVPEAMPESRGRGLHFAEVEKVGKPGDDVIAVYRLTDVGFENVTQRARSDAGLPQGRYLVASVRLANSSGWFGGQYYVDLLHPGVVDKFIEITMEPYRREIGQHFGKRVPGVFTDEPHLTPAGGIHWSDRIPHDFRARWGYDLLDHLPSLIRPVGDWKRVRHNYQQFLLEEFIACWAKPMYEYCEKHELEFTGHYWEHGWPGASHGGDNMAMYAWHQRPAIDNLMNQYSEGVHGQFGNSRTVRELASVANQLGRRRTLCEAYGAGGWDLRFEDMKRIGDWLYVLGVNTLNEHLSYVTIRGARKRDHPQSFSYHTPWWEGYHVMAEYFTRLSLVLSSGQQVNHVLLLQPTTTAWMYQPDGSHHAKLNAIGDSFQRLIVAWERDQVEYDIGCEDIIARHGSTEDKLFNVGRRSYHTVVLPPHTENLNGKTMELLEAFADAGGRVIHCGPPPTHVDGRPSDRAVNAAKNVDWKRVDGGVSSTILLGLAEDGFAIRRAEDDRGTLFHQRRRFDDGEFLFLVNTSIDASSTGAVESAARSIQRWDLQAGQVSPYPFTPTASGVSAAYDLPPCGSLLLFLSPKKQDSPAAHPRHTTKGKIVQPIGPMQIRRTEPNVLTLDYVDITAGDESKKNVYFYAANQFAFQKNGMERNPWDSAVQFRDQLITRTFPPNSGFQAAYRFRIRDEVPTPLHIVIERPDLYAITCNGRRVTAEDGAWWLDKAFGKIDITAAACVGDNVVTISAKPFTIYHELEPAYVLGDFAVEPAESGFVIAPDRSLTIASQATHSTTPNGSVMNRTGWDQQGHPFYAAGVAYSQTFDVSKPTGRYVITLPAWYGSVAKVVVNGGQAGYIASQPWQYDVTEKIRPGQNVIDVIVIGTLKNTLGPHHGNPALGSAWPGSFQRGPATGPPPGRQYHTVGYGLFEPFTLEQIGE